MLTTQHRNFHDPAYAPGSWVQFTRMLDAKFIYFQVNTQEPAPDTYQVLFSIILYTQHIKLHHVYWVLFVRLFCAPDCWWGVLTGS